MHLFTAATRPTGQVGVGFLPRYNHNLLRETCAPEGGLQHDRKKVPGIAKYCQGCKVLDEEVVQLARAGLGDR